jgi:hypothetical protein
MPGSVRSGQSRCLQLDTLQPARDGVGLGEVPLAAGLAVNELDAKPPAQAAAVHQISASGDKRLGHSNISLTMNTYSHVMPDLQREAADKMDAILVSR